MKRATMASSSCAPLVESNKATRASFRASRFSRTELPLQSLPHASNARGPLTRIMATGPPRAVAAAAIVSAERYDELASWGAAIQLFVQIKLLNDAREGVDQHIERQARWKGQHESPEDQR